MRVFYDTEFIEDGRTIDLISIGMVTEEGRELYLINRDAPWRRIKKDPWLMEHVVSQLPQPRGDWRNHAPRSWLFDMSRPNVRAERDIRDAVEEFLLSSASSGSGVELWADYAAYDHVVLAQLWGKMIHLPDGIPMWTNDLRQEIHRLGNPPGCPEQRTGQHDALADARHLLEIDRWLRDVTGEERHA